MSLLQTDKSDLVKRFQMIYHRNDRRKRGLNALLVLLTILVFTFSYLFIFEAYYETENTEGLGSNDFYLIDNLDGTYDVYIDAYLIETIDSSSLEHYAHVPIYTELPPQSEESAKR